MTQVTETAPETKPAEAVVEAKATKKPKKTAEEKAAEKQAKDAAKPVVEVKAKDTKNGVTRPAKGVTLLVWTTADALSAAAKAPTERAPLVGALKGKVEVGTVHTQYGRWRKYYGLVETKEQRQVRLTTARVKKDEAKAAEKVIKDAEKATKEAEKAAAKQKAADDKAAAKALKDAEAAAKAAAPETAQA
jgi:hypothetical protein